jgi:hypothetical protein
LGSSITRSIGASKRLSITSTSPISSAVACWLHHRLPEHRVHGQRHRPRFFIIRRFAIPVCAGALPASQVLSFGAPAISGAQVADHARRLAEAPVHVTLSTDASGGRCAGTGVEVVRPTSNLMLSVVLPRLAQLVERRVDHRPDDRLLELGQLAAPDRQPAPPSRSMITTMIERFIRSAPARQRRRPHRQEGRAVERQMNSL